MPLSKVISDNFNLFGGGMVAPPESSFNFFYHQPSRTRSQARVLKSAVRIHFFKP